VATKKKVPGKQSPVSRTTPAPQKRGSIPADSAPSHFEIYRPLVEIMPAAATIVDHDGIIRIANVRAAQILGYDRPDEIIGMMGTSLVAPEERTEHAEVKQILKTSAEFQAAALFLRRDGSRFPAEYHISEIRDPKGSPSAYLVIIYDIMERKRKDAELRESEERYRRITGAITDYIYTVRLDGGRPAETIHSPACEGVTGYTSDEFSRDPYLWINMVHEEDRESVKLMSERLMSGEDTGPLEHRIWRKEGSLRWIRNTPVIHRSGIGRIISYDGIISDITEQKRSEAALKESEERYRIITELSTDYVFKIAVNEDGSLVMTYVSENLHALTGRTRDEVASSTLWRDIIHPDDWASFVNFQVHLVTSGEPGELDCRTFLKDGTMRRIHIFARPLRDPGGGSVTAIVGAIKDVTERRAAEDKLSETRRQLEFIIGVTRTGIDIIDAGFTLRYVDPEWQKTYGPYEGKKCYDYFMKRDAVCPGCGIPRALETKEVTVTEETLPGEDNRVIEVHTIPFQAEGGEWMVAEFNIDITERKKADESIRTSLAEKETLLKEIHHRVKNNLQIITSLLSLQSRYFTDAALVRQFTEAQNRIRSMALVHEKLYQSKDFGRIDFRSYIIQLAHDIMSSYTAAGKIDLRLAIEESDISIDQAIPCGLIINELLTNAIKHAFPAGWAGSPEIEVIFHITEGGAAELAIRDNGVSIPETTEPGKTDTLGLSLVPLLAQQIKGEVTLDRSRGSAFTLRFTQDTTHRRQAR
jgi:PAS domain S-box-containing protein